jgi:hypothetical protein
VDNATVPVLSTPARSEHNDLQRRFVMSGKQYTEPQPEAEPSLLDLLMDISADSQPDLSPAERRALVGEFLGLYAARPTASDPEERG